jgi:GT2 family glycosyltransferase/glycosyltransferase involved in cell wall biosynthesis
MKVLEVVHGLPPHGNGGAELYAYAHARELHERHGDDVVLLTREADGGRPEYAVRGETREGLRVAWVNHTFRDTQRFDETYVNEAIGAIADRIIDEFRPDVAHIHHLTCLSTTIVCSLAARRVPVFFTLHDYWLLCHRGQLLDVNYRVCAGPRADEGCHACLGAAGGAHAIAFAGARAVRAMERRLPGPAARGLRWAAERVAAMGANAAAGEDEERQRIAHMRRLCGNVTQFLAPSRYARDRFAEFGVPADRMTVWPYGVAASPRAACGARPEGLRLGYAGSLMISKGVHVLLDAAGRLPAGSVSVSVFGAHASYHGDNGYRRQLEPLLAADHVQVHGPVPHDQIASAFASIDVLVVPSIWPENSPFVIHEAFRAGVPVVASRIGGIPELVEDGRNGLLCSPGNADDLAHALGRLVREPGLLAALGRGISPPRSLEDDVGATRELYSRCLSGERRYAPNQTGPANCASSSAPAKTIAAVVLNFCTPDQTLLTVKSLLASRRALDHLIVINNDTGESDGETRSVLADVLQRIRYISAGANLGFAGGMNVGIREALALGADYVLLVNSDVVVPPDTVKRLEQRLAADSHAGIAGPVILARSDPRLIASLGMSYAYRTGRMRHRGHGRRIVPDHEADSAAVDAVSGCVMLVRRAVFEAAGLLEEEFFFSFEDLDFCLKAGNAGFSTVLAGDAAVYHEGGRSLGARSPRRFYYAARNHLLAAERSAPSAGRYASFGRSCWIVGLNLAHALVAPGGSVAARVAAVARGTYDYGARRFGPGR